MQNINFKTLTITSLVAGFFLIPLHELGHVVCDWITGHPAAMSYARDYLLSGGKTPFLGLLGGPLFPLILSAVSVILIYRGIHLSVFYPLAVLGTLDRLLLYLSGSTPSDERELAQAIDWPVSAFKHIFLAAEIFLLALVLLSLIRYKAGIKRSVLIFVIPLASFVICASFGVFVVDRFLFPVQHRIEFGLNPPHSCAIELRAPSAKTWIIATNGDRRPSRSRLPLTTEPFPGPREG
jgi:hypothetical protein